MDIFVDGLDGCKLLGHDNECVAERFHSVKRSCVSNKSISKNTGMVRFGTVAVKVTNRRTPYELNSNNTGIKSARSTHLNVRLN